MNHQSVECSYVGRCNSSRCPKHNPPEVLARASGVERIARIIARHTGASERDALRVARLVMRVRAPPRVFVTQDGDGLVVRCTTSHRRATEAIEALPAGEQEAAIIDEMEVT